MDKNIPIYTDSVKNSPINYQITVIYLYLCIQIELQMKVIFDDEALEELYVSGKTKDNKYKSLSKDKKLVEGFRRAVSIMYDVDKISDLKPISFLHYEKLKYRAESSVRIVNGRIERLLFIEKEDGIEVTLIEIDRTHYGNKG